MAFNKKTCPSSEIVEVRRILVIVGRGDGRFNPFRSGQMPASHKAIADITGGFCIHAL